MFELEPFQASSQTSKIKIYSEAFLDKEELQLTFILEDKNKVVLMNKGSSPLRTHELWKTTCFEAFFGVKGSPSYWELNVSFGGSWNVYRFNDYRNPTLPTEEKKIQNISFHSDSEDDSLRIEIKIPISALDIQNKKLDASLNTVIEFKNKEKAYFALKHGSEKPDFHQRDSFICNLG